MGWIKDRGSVPQFKEGGKVSLKDKIRGESSRNIEAEALNKIKEKNRKAVKHAKRRQKLDTLIKEAFKPLTPKKVDK